MSLAHSTQNTTDCKARDGVGRTLPSAALREAVQNLLFPLTIRQLHQLKYGAAVVLALAFRSARKGHTV